MLSYKPIEFNANKIKVAILKEGDKFYLEMEQDDQLIRIKFETKQQLIETIFFETAEKIQKFLKEGE